MFSLECANLIELKKCKKRIIFHNKIKSDLFLLMFFKSNLNYDLKDFCIAKLHQNYKYIPEVYNPFYNYF